ncbi:CsbD family protein [Streptomyces sp. NPDC058326]|uniref:CsbD family protein n=1 Tax=Streptomyces sp. NPDC058326 TaxID=3346447 RepID=UPI0036E6B77E
MAKSGMEKGKGKVKETVGKMTGKKGMEAEGRAEQLKGKAREATEKGRRGGTKAVDDLKKRGTT